jgi:hypothetical protein
VAAVGKLTAVLAKIIAVVVIALTVALTFSWLECVIRDWMLRLFGYSQRRETRRDMLHA